jgi:hypothetical protein
MDGPRDLAAGVEVAVSHGLCAACAKKVEADLDCAGCAACDSEPATSDPFAVVTNQDIERLERAR